MSTFILYVLLAVASQSSIHDCMNRPVVNVAGKDVMFLEIAGDQAQSLCAAGDDPVVFKTVRRLLVPFVELHTLRLMAREVGIEISEEDLIAVDPDGSLVDDAALDRRIAFETAIPRAARRVLAGDEIDEVHAEDLAIYSINGVTLDAFRKYLDLFNSEERVDQALGYYHDRDEVRRRIRDRLEPAALERRLHEWAVTQAGGSRLVLELLEAVRGRAERQISVYDPRLVDASLGDPE